MDSIYCNRKLCFMPTPTFSLNGKSFVAINYRSTYDTKPSHLVLRILYHCRRSLFFCYMNVFKIIVGAPVASVFRIEGNYCYTRYRGSFFFLQKNKREWQQVLHLFYKILCSLVYRTNCIN